MFLLRWLLFFTLCGCIQAATYVQGCVNTGTTTATCAIGSNVTSGDLLVVVSKADASTGVAGSIAVSSSSGVSCTWNSVITPQYNSTDHFSSAMSYCQIPSTGAETVQISWSGGPGTSFTDIAVAEYSSTTGWVTPAFDVSSSFFQTSTGSTTCSSGTTATTSNASDLVVGVCEGWNAAQTWGSLSGWTNRTASNRNTVGWYDTTVSTTGTQTFSLTISNADSTIGFVAAFKQIVTTTAATMVPAVY